MHSARDFVSKIKSGPSYYIKLPPEMEIEA